MATLVAAAATIISAAMKALGHALGFDRVHSDDDKESLQHTGSASNRSAFFFDIAKDDDVLGVIGDSVTPSIEQDIRILVWNMFKGSRRNCYDELSRFCQGVDLVLLQEVNLDANLEGIYRSLEYQWIYAKSFYFVRQNGRPSTGVAIGAKAKAESMAFLRSQGREPISSTPKMAVVAVYPIKDGNASLMVVTIHAINFVTDYWFELQMKQIKTTLAAHRGPAICAGDFNAWSPSRTRIMLSIITDLAFAAASYDADHRLKFLYTYPLDHIFVRGLHIIASETKLTTGSDHNPLFATFKIDDGYFTTQLHAVNEDEDKTHATARRITRK